jgi:hypothetical protein
VVERPPLEKCLPDSINSGSKCVPAGPPDLICDALFQFIGRQVLDRPDETLVGCAGPREKRGQELPRRRPELNTLIVGEAVSTRDWIESEVRVRAPERIGSSVSDQHWM